MSEAQTIESGFEAVRRELASAGRNLWLAGLGAVAEMEEGGRDLFDHLVKRGRPMEKKQRKALTKVGDKTNETVRELGKLVQDTMEYETKGFLKKLGLLTRDDVKVLAARLDTLSKKIDELSARQQEAARPVIVTLDEPAASTAPKARRPRQPKQ
jgi:poly(hydroxyalkanoate) granule-associated protein